MNPKQEKIALVTGASSGIGSSLVRRLATQGISVIGCARREDKLKELALEVPGKIFPYKCDVANEAEIEEMFQWIENRFERLDIVVANAGFSTNKSLMDAEIDDWRRMMNVNVISVSYLTQLAVKMFLKHFIMDGHIIYMNSISAHIPITTKTIRFYGITKTAMKSLLESWKQEIHELQPPNNIRISQICPGIVKTEFVDVMYGDSSHKEKIVKQFFEQTPFLNPEDVVDAVMYILEKPVHVNIQDIIMRNPKQGNLKPL